MSTTKRTTQPVPPPTDQAPRIGEPLTRRRGIRAWAMSALRDVVYAGAVFVWSFAAFTILVTGVSVTVSLLVFVVGVFVWVGFVYVVRWTTWVDRRLAGWQRHERVEAVYRRPAARGFLPLLKTVSSDPQTWRDLVWLGRDLDRRLRARARRASRRLGSSWRMSRCRSGTGRSRIPPASTD